MNEWDNKSYETERASHWKLGHHVWLVMFLGPHGYKNMSKGNNLYFVVGNVNDDDHFVPTPSNWELL